MWYRYKIAIIIIIFLTAGVVFPNCCENTKQEVTAADNPKNSSQLCTNKQMQKADTQDKWQVLSFYHRHWIYFHSLYVDYQGKAVYVTGEGIDVNKYAFGKISDSALAGLRQEVEDTNIQSLKPSYSTENEDGLATETDQFELRLLNSENRHVVRGELEAAPEFFRKFCRRLQVLLKGQTKVQDTPAKLFIRVVPFSRAGPDDKNTKKMLKPIRKGGNLVPIIDAETLKKLPCLTRAIEREGLIVPCKNSDLIRKYIPGVGKIQINGNYYNVEFFIGD